jgi:hypothetical protein
MNTIKKHIFYPIELYNTQIDLNIESMIDKLYNLKNYDSKGIANINSGGWQSNRDIQNLDEFLPLTNIIQDFTQFIFKSKSIILDMWGSIYSKHDYNNIHNHPPLNSQYSSNPLWSGVYYLKTYLGSGGFNIHSYHNPTDKTTLYPKEGELYLFNSSTYHSVDPNLEDKDRICIAFNLTLA